MLEVSTGSEGSGCLNSFIFRYRRYKSIITTDVTAIDAIITTNNRRKKGSSSGIIRPSL